MRAVAQAVAHGAHLSCGPAKSATGQKGRPPPPGAGPQLDERERWRFASRRVGQQQHGTAQGRNCGMVLGGVPVEDWVVRELVATMQTPLGRKLQQALLFRAKIVALTRDERLALLAALESGPAEFD